MYNTQQQIDKLMVLLTKPEEAERQGIKSLQGFPKPTEKNKQLIESYYQWMTIKGFKKNTIFTKLKILRFISCYYEKDYEAMTKQDVTFLLYKIVSEKTLRGEERAASSKANMQQQFKSFLKYLYDEGYLREPLFETIHAKIPQTTVTADDVYTENEVNAMIEKALNLRDKALVALLYDAGGRIGEILPMKLKQVENMKNIIRITISGKTGTRTLLLDFSIYHVRQWINAHPDRNNPEAYLWCYINDEHDGRKEGHVEYSAILKKLKSIAKKAGINKKIYPHAFRHSSVTRDAEHFSEALNKNKHGWTPNSNMLSRYSHITSANLEKAQMEKRGLTPVTIKKELNTCSNCHEANPYDFIHCGRCGNPLTLEARDEEAKVKDAMAEMMKDTEFMRIFQEKLLGMTA